MGSSRPRSPRPGWPLVVIRRTAARPAMLQSMRHLHDHHPQRLGCARGPRRSPPRAPTVPGLQPSRPLLSRAQGRRPTRRSGRVRPSPGKESCSYVFGSDIQRWGSVRSSRASNQGYHPSAPVQTQCGTRAHHRVVGFFQRQLCNLLCLAERS